jgi:hypothetical protein
VAREHVRVLPYGRHGHVFHLCARPLYAAIGEEHNRNRRLAEWDAVTRKLMTVDFVLAKPTAQFWASEADKVALLRELRVEPHVWPARRYAARTSAAVTTRYFVDKMPWYRTPDDPRLWVAYVDAERTLGGFDTFLGQYRDLLWAVSSGVTYVAPKGWRGAVHTVFTKIMGNGQPATFPVATFLDYCRLRRAIEADQLGSLSISELQRFATIRAAFSSSAFDALYTRWYRDGDTAISGTDVGAVIASRCLFQIHELGFRYDAERPAT